MRIDPTKTLVALFLLSLAGSSFAQTDEERAGARAAASKGVNAFSQGNWAEAADLMARAEKLVHSPTHLLYLGQAQEHQGQLVAAQETYFKIVREKLRPDAPEVFRTAQQEAQKRLDGLSPRIPQISIVVQGTSSDQPVTVMMDGKNVPEALVGVPHPVDPGAHEFGANVGERRSNLVKIELREGTTETVVLTLPATGPGEAAKAPGASGSNANPGTSVGVDSQDVTSAASGTSPLRIASYASLGVGVVGLGLGTVFAVISSNKSSDADKACDAGADGKCRGEPSKVQSLDDDAKSAKTISVISFVGGGVGLAAGITMYLLSSPTKESAPKSAWVTPYVSPSMVGVVGGF
ncbi:MAG: hypothetical protein QM784_31580 [Polyangiaceae bacterium]